MPLPPSTRFNRYEIHSLLGVGGMGEVYLAEDTRLHRKVALKVLPAELASNDDRMRRFGQEATSAAALNHPNIAHIYEIGEDNGTHFIAMEFVDGRTLRELIYRQRVELPKLLRHLQHVAEGLAKAHAAGIVHRDLKPDNIMVTRDGHAKVLDFGLAKLVEQTPAASGDSSEVATALMPQHSTPGTVMGTVGYMSPEQVRGAATDHRSDIFSFGVILYEMLSGRRAFAGDSVVELPNAILKDDVPELDADGATKVSPALDKIMRRCLEKRPEHRFHSAHDLCFALGALSAPTSSSGGGLTTTASAAVVEPGRPVWRGWIPWIVAGGFALVAVVLGPSISGLRVTAGRR